MEFKEHCRKLNVKTCLVSHLDPLRLSEYFSSKVDPDSPCGHSLSLLHNCIQTEVEHFESGDPAIDDDFFSMLTIDGIYELVALKVLDVPIFVNCYDGIYREMPSIIMTIRERIC